MRREVRWERMFADELERACEAHPIVYLPYGLCEPHGPHNALGMDALRAHSACRIAAEIHGGIVAPPFFWNIHEIGQYGSWSERMIGNRRPWLTAYPPWMFFKSLLYHIRTVDMLEIKGAILFTGHSGPHAKDMRRFLERIQPHVSVRLDYLIGLATQKDHFRDGLDDGGHAGRGETSLLWATDPDCVDVSRLPDVGETGPRFALGGHNEKASRRAGAAGVAEIAARMGDIGAVLLRAYEEHGPAGRAMSYLEVEGLWNDEILPDVMTYACMTEAGQEPAQDSRWRANWDFPERAPED